jgi:hypothetical protein
MFSSIVVPTRVMDMHPEWASCTPLTAGGLWDPPITLHPGVMLVPTTSIPTTTQLLSAVPRTSLAVPAATQTSSLSLRPKVVAASASPQRGDYGPLATMVFPPPILGQPNHVPIIMEPNQPPGQDAFVSPQVTPIQSTNLLGFASDIERTALEEYVALTPPPRLLVFTLDGEAVTANTASQFVIGTQTLVPGGSIIIGATTISLNIGLSRVIIDATSTISLRQILQTTRLSEAGEVHIKTYVTVIMGGTTVTRANGRTSIVGGTTTTIPAAANEEELYTVIIDGYTTTLGDGRVSIIGGSTTVAPAVIAQNEINVTLTIGGLTLKLPGGSTTVVGGKKTVIPLVLSPGTASITLAFGGHTSTLPDGRVTVHGATTTVIAAPEMLGGMATTTVTFAHASSGQESLTFDRISTTQGFGRNDGSEQGTNYANGDAKLGVTWVHFLFTVFSVSYFALGIWSW